MYVSYHIFHLIASIIFIFYYICSILYINPLSYTTPLLKFVLYSTYQFSEERL